MDTKPGLANAAPEGEKREKYVRTFAGDMETLKSGGTPDLVPLVETPHPQERLIAASPLEATKGTASSSVPAQAPAAPAPVYTPPPAASAPIQTYSDDFSQRMKETNASAATVLAAEQDSAPAPILVQSSAPASNKNLFYVIAGVLLLVVGIAGAVVAYLQYQTAATPPVVVAPVVSAPIFVDEREQVEGSGATLLAAIQKSVARPIASGVIRLLYLSPVAQSDPQVAQSIIEALDLSVPGSVLRDVNASESMAGIVFASGKQSPFFILSVSSYSNTFAGMLSWEKTMLRDLAGLFPVQAAEATAPAVATTTTGSLTSAPQTVAGFTDAIVDNHDVRVYRDTVGSEILVYGYWNQTTLVIARDSAAFAEILGRLASSRAQN